MATYQDIHRVIKETIQVDADPTKRWTPQEVRFINSNNVFEGAFKGKVDATEFFASNCGLSNVNLSSCKLYDLSGNELDMTDILRTMNDISGHVQRVDRNVSSIIHEYIPGVITYVNAVSSDLSTIFCEKIKEGSEQTYRDISSISSFLHNEICSEISTRIESDKNFNDKITEISSKIKGGVVYKGFVYNMDSTTISDLILTHDPDYTPQTELRKGFLYVVKGDRRIIEGLILDNGDYLYINPNDRSDVIIVKNITSSDIDVLDAMDSDVRSKISEISSGLSSLSDYIENLSCENVLTSDCGISIITDISQSGGKLNVTSKRLVSSDISYLSDYVTTEINLSIQNLSSGEKIETEGYILSSLVQSNGIIEAKTVPILSSYVHGLSDFVEVKIDEKLEYFDVDPISAENQFIYSVEETDGKVCAYYRSIQDDDITEESISQNKIINLSTDLYNISSSISSLSSNIEDLDVEVISASHGQIIDGVWQTDGKISASTRELVSSDVKYLENYVQTEVGLSVGEISGTYNVSEGKIISSITQENGKLTIHETEILSSNVVGLENYVESKIKDLSVGEITGNISTLSSNLDSLSTDYHTLKENTFIKIEEPSGIESMGLILTDEKLIDPDTAKRKRYVLTVSDGMMVLKKN